MDRQQIQHIISKKITGSLSDTEEGILEKWIAQSSENKKEFESYFKLWEKSNDLVFSGTIDVESSLIQTKRHIVEFNSKRRWITYLRQAAAVLLLSLSLTFLYNYIVNSNKPVEVPEKMVFQEISASYGTQINVVLADGTKVWLNSGSSLRFPTSFKNSDKRIVELNGEGFFDVTKDLSKPFTVKTSNLDVKVYGTSFNVSAYEDYESMTVALLEGKVSLIKSNGNSERELIVLNPNEVVEYNIAEKKGYYSTNEYMRKYTAWKNGQIVFNNDPIEVVTRRLEKWYNVKINISNEQVPNYRFTATFIDESLEQVLYLLSLSSAMEYKIIPAKKQADNSFSQRNITLSFKK
ncbi:MAG: FecR domain-containing protein [Bacteroidota bacterium]